MARTRLTNINNSVQRELPHTRVGSYVISAISVEIYGWMTGQTFFFSDLTLFSTTSGPTRTQISQYSKQNCTHTPSHKAVLAFRRFQPESNCAQNKLCKSNCAQVGTECKYGQLYTVKRSPAEIHRNLIGRSMTAAQSMLSPSSILPS
jgi:hypothetical protein